MAPARVEKAPEPITLPFVASTFKAISQNDSLFDADTQSLTITDLLKRASKTDEGVEIYTLGHAGRESEWTTYAKLLRQAESDAQRLHQIPDIRRDSILLLHFDNHRDNIRWFWAAVLGGYLPCISTAFADDPSQKQSHVKHLRSILDDPIALVNPTSARDFSAVTGAIRLVYVADLDSYTPSSALEPPGVRKNGDIAALMLTSGSTGNAKAVCLTHKQMIASAIGKSRHNHDATGDVFLNWIALDHAVNLVEMHLQAILLGCKQVQVHARDLLENPLLFLELVHKHRITVSFAPNFFLNLVQTRALEVDPGLTNRRSLDLSSLRSLYSGGEASDTQTIADFTSLFRAYGNKHEFVHPAYGLTESCAGMAFATGSPSYDVGRGLKYASIGRAIPGCEMRVVRKDGADASVGEVGELQLKGMVIFPRYYNNAEATADAFTADGWFKTGDQGYLDENEKMNLTGRSKDLLIINGVNYYPQQIESAIEQVQISGLVPSFTAVFSHRPARAQTESYIVLYKPSYAEDDVRARVDADNAISKVGSSITKIQPFRIIPLPESRYHKSSIGKLSRAKLRISFEKGEYDSIDLINRRLIREYRIAHRKQAVTATEKAVLAYITAEAGLDADETSIDSNIFQLGLTSLDLFSMTAGLKQQLKLNFVPDLVSILKKPTIEEIARIIDEDSAAVKPYDPIVPLQTAGEKTPIFIIHPASGNVLAFLYLAQLMPDRPVYGVRATGVKPGERFFDSFPEMAKTYHKAIVRKQPHGPYAIVGYSLGSSVAFEIAKLLEADGEEVRLLAALDSPPDIAPLVGHLPWSAGLAMISFFYGLITEQRANVIIPELWDSQPREALDRIMAEAEPGRLAALQLDREGLSHVADVTANFARACKTYAPEGAVRCMDVFVVDPLESVAADRRQWMDEHLVRWKGHVRDENVRYHQCDGTHSDMLTERYVHSFQRRLRAVMAERGI